MSYSMIVCIQCHIHSYRESFDLFPFCLKDEFGNQPRVVANLTFEFSSTFRLHRGLNGIILNIDIQSYSLMLDFV